jgi:AraC family transcriptional regulator
MGHGGRRLAGRDLIDFASRRPLRRIETVQRLVYGDVAVARGALRRNDGAHLGSLHVTALIHDGPSFELAWQPPGSDRVRSATIDPGNAHITDARQEFWQRWDTGLSFFAFALNEALVEHVWQTAFDGVGDRAIETAMGQDDPVIRQFVDLGRQELALGGAGGRLYVEGLASALAVHLLRRYRTTQRVPAVRKGGLAPWQLRRIVEHIHDHLDSDLGLIELATIAGLSSHHFGEAFKISMGISPHRYVIEQRVQRAAKLLNEGAGSVAEIAYAVGFSSQSHLTTNFHRIIGVTPGQFRRMRK